MLVLFVEKKKLRKNFCMEMASSSSIFNHGDKKGERLKMKREKIFFGVGCLMVVVAIGFMVFALNHPEMSFPWSNNITYVIYVVYLVVTIFMFCISKKTKKK